MSTRFLTILCAVVCSATLLISYWTEGMRMKHARETSVNTEVAPTKVEVEKTKLPPMIAGAVVEFLEVATTQTPSKMVPIALEKNDDLRVIAESSTSQAKVRVTSSGRVSVLDDCQTALAAKPVYENPDGDGAAYQEDVIGYVFQTEDAPSYVLDTPSDYPSP